MGSEKQQQFGTDGARVNEGQGFDGGSSDAFGRGLRAAIGGCVSWLCGGVVDRVVSSNGDNFAPARGEECRAVRTIFPIIDVFVMRRLGVQARLSSADLKRQGFGSARAHGFNDGVGDIFGRGFSSDRRRHFEPCGAVLWLLSTDLSVASSPAV